MPKVREAKKALDVVPVKIARPVKLENDVVVEHNALTHGKTDMSLLQLQILLITIMQIRKIEDEFREITLPVKELIYRLGLSETHGYKRLKEAVKGLCGESIVIDTSFVEEGTKEQIPLIAKAKYYSIEQEIKIKLNDELRPYLLNLKDNFVIFNSSLIGLFGSKKTLIFFLVMYSDLMRYCSRNKNFLIGIEAEYSLNELKNFLGLSERYSVDNIQRKVIQPIQENIQSVLPYYLNYEVIKRGRAVSGFCFRFAANPDALNSNGMPFLSQKEFQALSLENLDRNSKQYKFVIHKLKEFEMKDIDKLFELGLNDVERVWSNVNFVIQNYKNKNTTNDDMCKLFFSAVKEDYVGDERRKDWLTK